MDTGGGDKTNTDNDLFLPQTDSFWEVSVEHLRSKRKYFFLSCQLDWKIQSGSKTM